MRPLQLKLTGINSYREEQIIDFETLTSQGLFGIFGPTGSGKSSILDAMTLALYAKLPCDTKNFINTNEKKATVSFLFSITTDKTRKYLAERSFRYHTGNSASTVRNTTGRLILYEGDTETVLADKPTEVTNECIRLLGLTSEDFMRTVVLPQGQFSEFLRLKNKERRVMLQRIFHLEKYGIELTGKIARARQKQDLLLSTLSGEKKGYEDISSQKLSSLKKEKKENTKQCATLSEQLTVLEKNFEETNELFSLQQELSPLEEQKKETEKKLSSIKQKEKQLDTAKKANQLRSFSDQVSQTKSICEEAEKRLQHIQKEVDSLHIAFEAAKKAYDEVHLSQKETLPALQKEEQLLENSLSTINTIQSWSKSQKDYERQNQELLKTLSPLKEKQQSQFKKEEDMRKQIENIEAELDADKVTAEKKALLEKGNIMEENYREKHQNYTTNSEVLSDLKAKIITEKEAFTLKKRQLEYSYIQLSHRLSYLEKQHSDLTEKLTDFREKETQNKQQQKLLQQNHMAQLLREELQEGVVCPVCGIPYEKHDLPTESSPFSLKDLEETQKNLEKNIQQLQNRIMQIEKEFASLNTQLPNLKEALEITTQNDLSDMISAPDLQKKTPNNPPIVPDYSAISRQHAEYLQAKGHLQQQENQYAEQNTLLKEQHATLQNYVEKIFSLRKENNIENFSIALKNLRNREEHHQKQEKALKEKRLSLEILLSEKESLSSQIISLENESSSLTATIDNCKKVITEQTEKIPKQFSFDMDFPLALNKVKEKQENIKTRFSKAEKVYQNKQKELQQKREELGSCESTAVSSHTHLKQMTQLYQNQKNMLGFKEEEQPECYYMEEIQINQLHNEIDTYYTSARKTEEQILYLKNKLGNRHIEEEDWRRQKEERDSARNQINTLTSSLLLLDHQIQEMTERLTEKQKLEEQWEKETHKKDMIKELEQLFKGNAFIEYVAQAKLAYIAREASVILSKISGGNYTLEINESAEFIIRDNKNGGAIRPSDTLSGGEMFITSLALALALSSSIQLNGAAPLEFFFLDEGFGSLDDDLLDTVMNSLEQLQSKKRSIGIISHVEAIQTRVPVKLLVTPSDLSQKGSQITLEYS